MASILLPVFAGLSPAGAAILVTYNGGTSGTTTTSGVNFDPAVTGANLSASIISQPAAALSFSSLPFTPPIYDGQSNVLQANTIDTIAARPAGATPADSEYFMFTLTPEAGYGMSFSQITFKAARGGGSVDRGYDVRSSLDNYQNTLGAANIPTQRSEGFSNITLNLGNDFTNLFSPVTIRFYVYSPSPVNSIEFDDISVDGSLAVVPEPSSALLGMGALMALAMGRRVRRWVD